MDKVFCDLYYVALVKYLLREIEGFPTVFIGEHRGQKVVRVKSVQESKLVRREYKTSSPKAQKYISINNKILKLQNELDSYKDLLSICSMDDIYVDVESKRLLPISLKDVLVPESNDYPNNEDYWYKGIHMRSRLEIIVAQVLDSLNLEYYYEPEMYVNGKRLFPDFVVFLPALGCCFIIECLGRCDDKDYLLDNTIRSNNYFVERMNHNYEIVMFMGGKHYIPPVEEIRSVIINTVNNLTYRYVHNRK